MVNHQRLKDTVARNVVCQGLHIGIVGGDRAVDLVVLGCRPKCADVAQQNWDMSEFTGKRRNWDMSQFAMGTFSRGFDISTSHSFDSLLRGNCVFPSLNSCTIQSGRRVVRIIGLLLWIKEERLQDKRQMPASSRARLVVWNSAAAGGAMCSQDRRSKKRFNASTLVAVRPPTFIVSNRTVEPSRARRPVLAHRKSVAAEGAFPFIGV